MTFSLKTDQDVFDALIDMGYETDKEGKDLMQALTCIHVLKTMKFRIEDGISGILSDHELFYRFYQFMTIAIVKEVPGGHINLDGNLDLSGTPGEGSEYKSESNTIFLDGEAIVLSVNQQDGVIQLAHELGHRFSPITEDNSSLFDYARTLLEDEAESIICEFRALYV